MKATEFVSFMQRVSAKHLPTMPSANYCVGCGEEWPCDSRQLIDVIHTIHFKRLEEERENHEQRASATPTPN